MCSPSPEITGWDVPRRVHHQAAPGRRAGPEANVESDHGRTARLLSPVRICTGEGPRAPHRAWPATPPSPSGPRRQGVRLPQEPRLLRRRGIRCTIPDKADQARNRRKLGSRGGHHRTSTRSTTASVMQSSAGSTDSRDTSLSPRDTTSSPSATKRPSSSRPSTSGCNRSIRHACRALRCGPRSAFLPLAHATGGPAHPQSCDRDRADRCPCSARVSSPQPERHTSMLIRAFTQQDLAPLTELTIDTFQPFCGGSFHPLMREAVFAVQHGNWRNDYRKQVAELHAPERHITSPKRTAPSRATWHGASPRSIKRVRSRSSPSLPSTDDTMWAVHLRVHLRRDAGPRCRGRRDRHRRRPVPRSGPSSP